MELFESCFWHRAKSRKLEIEMCSCFRFARHRQSQLICPQCNKYEERLNRFPVELRLIYACTVPHSQRAGISLSFSLLFFFFFFFYFIFWFCFCVNFVQRVTVCCSFNFHFRCVFFSIFSPFIWCCFHLVFAASNMDVVAVFIARHQRCTLFWRKWATRKEISC